MDGGEGFTRPRAPDRHDGARSLVKLDVLHKGDTTTLTLTLGTMPNERHANAGNEQQRRQTACLTSA